jgi:hypothetical protein
MQYQKQQLPTKRKFFIKLIYSKSVNMWTPEKNKEKKTILEKKLLFDHLKQQLKYLRFLKEKLKRRGE